VDKALKGGAIEVYTFQSLPYEKISQKDFPCRHNDICYQKPLPFGRGFSLYKLTHNTMPFETSQESLLPRTPVSFEGLETREPLCRAVALSELLDLGLVARGHFVLSSGRHSDSFIDKRIITGNRKAQEIIGRLFAEEIQRFEFDMLAGPATGGNEISQIAMDAYYETTHKPVLRTRMTKTESGQDVQCPFDRERVKRKRILLLDDTATSGSSILQAKEAIEHIGGEVAGVIVLVNRNPKAVNEKSIKTPVNSIFKMQLKSWPKERVPGWLRNVPMNTDLGHGGKSS